MSSPPSLCNLPSELALRIFNRVGFRSILNLRKVSRDLRIRIDDIKPEANLSSVHIHVNDSEIRLIYYSKICTKDVENEVEYKKTANGRIIVTSGGSKKIVNGDFVEIASRDLQQILKFQTKSIKMITFISRTIYSKNFMQFLEFTKNFLAFENQLLKVDEFSIDAIDQKSVVNALSLVDPQSINSIAMLNWKIGSRQMIKFTEIMKMEHWKTAKSFSSTYCLTGVSAHNFRNFSSIAVDFQSISAKQLLEFKKVFQNSTEAKDFMIRYQTLVNREQFMEAMGPTFGNFEWFFRMSTTDDDVLRVLLIDAFITLFMFNRVPVTDVPEDAVIQN